MRYGSLLLLICLLSPHLAFSGPSYASGKVTSLAARGDDPAIRLSNNVSPDLCDGGAYGWLYFQGTPEQRSRIYSTALAMSLAGKLVTVYTNIDGGQCRIHTIEITEGLN